MIHIFYFFIILQAKWWLSTGQQTPLAWTMGLPVMFMSWTDEWCLEQIKKIESQAHFQLFHFNGFFPHLLANNQIKFADRYPSKNVPQNGNNEY